MPDFPSPNLVRLGATIYCTRPGCTKDTPCPDDVFVGVGLADNIPATPENIRIAYQVLNDTQSKFTYAEYKSELLRLAILDAGRITDDQ